MINKNKVSSLVKNPIFIVGAGHSGNSIIAKAIFAHPCIAPWHENNKVWIWGNAFRKNDVLTEKNLTPKIKKHIVSRFESYLKKSGKERICDKTPKNCLRIPFILSIFPDAKIIHIVRDGRAVIASTKSELDNKTNSHSFFTHLKVKLKGASIFDLYVFLPKLILITKKFLGLPINYWGAKPKNWQDWSDDEPYIKLAKQWNETVNYAAKIGNNYKPINYLEVRYEDFIADPDAIMLKIADFAKINDPQPILDFCKNNINTSRNKKRISSLTEKELNKIMKVIQPTLIKLGYE